ncbi:hypothetical protein EOM60_01085 [Candidatus Saccharibacteria bacterium]|nr:hypothetical protein [Candidatus Saccharibacteria bacterium]
MPNYREFDDRLTELKIPVDLAAFFTAISAVETTKTGEYVAPEDVALSALRQFADKYKKRPNLASEIESAEKSLDNGDFFGLKQQAKESRDPTETDIRFDKIIRAMRHDPSPDDPTEK